MKPKPFEIIVEFIPQSTKTGITYEAHQKGSLIRCNDCRYHDGRNRCEMWDMHKTDANDFCSSAERELET